MQNTEMPELPAIRYHIDASRCRACGVCVMACPEKAVSIVQAEGSAAGAGKATIDPDICSACGRCISRCRYGAIERDPVELDEIDSTNRYLKDLCIQGAPDGTVVTAKRQSSGRGRFTRTFSSPEGGLYYSQLKKNFPGGEDLVKITQLVATAVRRAVEESTGIAADIKWINDLYVNGRKVCGILCESISIGAETDIIIGIGINVNTSLDDYPEDLRDKVGSLAMAKGQPLDMDAVRKALTRQLDKLLARPKKLENEYFSEYRKYCYNFPEENGIMQEE